MELLDIITAAIAVGGIIFSCYGIRKQLRTELYAHYSRLYYDLMLEMMKCADDAKKQKDIAAIYIDLCSEEYQLNKQGKVDDDIWKQWREGMQYMLEQEPYVSVWQQRKEGYYDDDFVAFINAGNQQQR